MEREEKSLRIEYGLKKFAPPIIASCTSLQSEKFNLELQYGLNFPGMQETILKVQEVTTIIYGTLT